MPRVSNSRPFWAVARRYLGQPRTGGPGRGVACVVLALACMALVAAAQDLQQQGGSATSDGMLTTDVGVERVLGFAARMQNQLNSLLGVIGSSVVSDGGPGSPRVAGDVQPSTNAEAKQQEGGQGSPSVAAGSSVKTEARQHEEQISGTDSPGASGSGAGSGGIDSSLPASSNTTVLQRISLPAGQSAQITPDVGKTVHPEIGVDHIEGQLGSLCWSSHKLDFSSNRERMLPGGGFKGGLLMYGEGCRSCLAGELCSFTVLMVGYNTRWLTRKRTWGHMTNPRPEPLGDPFNWELPITLHGPALAAAQVTAVADNARILSVSFRVWDAGTYLINVSNPCMNLQIEGKTITHPVVAQIPLEIKEPPVPLPNPCLYSQHGRWLLKDDGKYRWTQYGCAREMPPISEVPALLQKKGIFEINIIGDSHLRLLTLHMHHLFLAPQGREDTPTYPYQKVDKHTWAFFEVPVANSTRPLKLNFHFATFIPNNKQYGCLAKTWDYRMRVSQTADVNLINVGAWTGTFCERKDQAIEPHVHNALRWAAAATNRKRLIFRTTTVPARGPNCLNTNSFVTWAVGIEKVLVQRYQTRLFDSYSVEAPRYYDSCPADVHFHCTHKVGNDTAYMEGVVGEALVHSFLEFLLYQMP